MGQDEGYSNGFLIALVSPNLVEYLHAPCLLDVAMRLNQYLSLPQAAGFDQLGMSIGLGQMM